MIQLPGGNFVIARKEMSPDHEAYVAVAVAGYVVAGIEYCTVLDGATYTEAVADVRSAIRFLRAVADYYGTDAE